MAAVGFENSGCFQETQLDLEELLVAFGKRIYRRSVNTGSARHSVNTGSAIDTLVTLVLHTKLHYPRYQRYLCITQDLRVTSLILKPLIGASTLNQE